MTDNYLLLAVERLTRPHTTKIIQKPENGDPYVSDVHHEPLLVLLRDAVAGGVGAHAGSASSARERIPFDAGALQLFDSIAKQINVWYILLPGAREDRYLHDRLSDWYVDFENRRRAGKVSDTVERDTVRLLEGWVRSIEQYFDPPIVFELTKIDPLTGRNVPEQCPVCAEPRAFDPRNGDVITALVIEYRNLGVETLDKATGLCRACEAVWRGSRGIRELRYAIDQAESMTA